MKSKSLTDLIRELPGYKIADAHFKIGAKIHITDFYYAKRFFQNSFFASRFAFILASQILKGIAKEDMSEKIPATP